jgi:hypothetical protein
VQILGTGMSAKMWEVTVEHARTCVLDDKKMFLYYDESGTASVLSDGYEAQTLEKCSCTMMKVAQLPIP